ELGTGLGENGLVAFARLESRLPSRGPGGAAVQVAQIAERAPAIARGVFTPARYGQVAPPAVTAPRARDRYMVSAIGKQMDFRARPTWIGKDPHLPLFFRRSGARRAGFRNMREDGDAGLGHALLEQKDGGAHHRIGFEAALHRPIQ